MAGRLQVQCSPGKPTACISCLNTSYGAKNLVQPYYTKRSSLVSSSNNQFFREKLKAVLSSVPRLGHHQTSCLISQHPAMTVAQVRQNTPGSGGVLKVGITSSGPGSLIWIWSNLAALPASPSLHSFTRFHGRLACCACWRRWPVSLLLRPPCCLPPRDAPVVAPLPCLTSPLDKSSSVSSPTTSNPGVSTVVPVSQVVVGPYRLLFFVFHRVQLVYPWPIVGWVSSKCDVKLR